MNTMVAPAVSGPPTSPPVGTKAKSSKGGGGGGLGSPKKGFMSFFRSRRSSAAGVQQALHKSQPVVVGLPSKLSQNESRCNSPADFGGGDGGGVAFRQLSPADTSPSSAQSAGGGGGCTVPTPMSQLLQSGMIEDDAAAVTPSVVGPKEFIELFRNRKHTETCGEVELKQLKARLRSRRVRNCVLTY